MDEKWNIIMIAGPDGSEAQARFRLQDRDSGATAEIQITVAGELVDLDDAEVDYEAPEWKAKKIFAAHGIDEAKFEGIKDEVRGRL